MKRHIQVVPGLMLISLLQACSSTPETPAPLTPEQQKAEVVKQLPAGYITNVPQASGNSLPDGVVKIRRYSKNYDIEMLLDATDDNVFFEMELPPDPAEKPTPSTELAHDVPHVPVEPAVKSEPEEPALEPKEPEKTSEPPLEQKPTDVAATEPKQPEAATTAAEDVPPKVTDADYAKSAKHVLYAQTYFYEEKHDRALSEVQQAIELTPNSAVPHALKGSIHYKKGEIAKARISWQRALELDPTLDNVRFMLEKLDQ